MDFDTAWEQYSPQIKAVSRTQYVPGLDADDIASEMSVCLWKATQTYQAGVVSFGSYWWSIWLNRRSDIAATHHAIKRAHGIPMEHMPEREYAIPTFPLPPSADPVHASVWVAIAEGHTPKEVQHDHHISRRRYYSIIEGWRTDEVRDRLTPG